MNVTKRQNIKGINFSPTPTILERKDQIGSIENISERASRGKIRETE